jgi:glycosyltransferase involved in cell wall biosynthesis
MTAPHIIRLTAPDIYEGDAVGNYCIDMAGCLRGLGLDVIMHTTNHAQGNPLAIRGMVEFFTDIRPGDTIITHYSILDSDLEAILALPNRKLCYFHGVTPPELLEAFEPVTADLCRRAQSQFPLLAGFDRVFANSHYSAASLMPLLGGKNVSPLPPIFPTRPLLSDKTSSNAKKDGNIVMVGRLVPHKNIELALGIFAATRRHMPHAHLNIVGELRHTEYVGFLKRRVTELGLAEAVTFTGKIGDDALRQRYQTASGFLCTSLHEGFCIPILEAMRFGVPVFVRTGNAAAEVAEGAGALFAGDDAATAGKMIADTLMHTAQAARMVDAGRQRANDLLAKNSPDFWQETLEKLGTE